MDHKKVTAYISLYSVDLCFDGHKNNIVRARVIFIAKFTHAECTFKEIAMVRLVHKKDILDTKGHRIKQ